MQYVIREEPFGYTFFDKSKLSRLVKELKLKTGNTVSFEYSGGKTVYGFQL